MRKKIFKIRDIFNEILIEKFNEFKNPYHIIVLINENDLPNSGQLNEGQWEQSEVSGYVQRIDKPNFNWEQLHIHIAREKNINTKNKQVSWNADGTRHDKKSFNDNFNGMETAKRIARNALGLPDNFRLENFDITDRAELILESLEYVPANTSLFIFVAQSPNNPKILLG